MTLSTQSPRKRLSGLGIGLGLALGIMALSACEPSPSDTTVTNAKQKIGPVTPTPAPAPPPTPPPGTVLPAAAAAQLGPVESMTTLVLTPHKLTAEQPFKAYALYENVRSLNGNPSERFPTGTLILNPGGKIGAMIEDRPKARGYISCGGVNLDNVKAEVEIGYKGLQPDGRTDLALIPAQFDATEGRLYAVGPQSFGDLRGANGRITLSLDPSSPPATLTDCVFGWVQVQKKKG
jgi:hypothetical protein